MSRIQLFDEAPMPLYEYQCLDCQTRDSRLAGIDDHMARCVNCGGRMLRLDNVDLAAYFRPSPACPWCGQKQPGTSRICQRHAAILREETTP